MPTVRELMIEVVTMLAVGVVLSALGPFGSFAMGGFAARLAYWVPVTLLAYAIYRPIMIAATVIARRHALPELPASLVGALVAAAPGAAMIMLLGGTRQSVGFERFFQLYLNVALIGLLVTLLFALLGQVRPQSATATPKVASAAPPPSAPFLDRLPPAWRDQLVALEMEDHYVRAHGPGTSELILLRMRDAEAELAALDGLRVHRSWWVARRAVEQVVRDGRSYRLRLAGGIEAPVARDRVAALKAAGWIG